jgi:hypothetical protein
MATFRIVSMSVQGCRCNTVSGALPLATVPKARIILIWVGGSEGQDTNASANKMSARGHIVRETTDSDKCDVTQRPRKVTWTGVENMWVTLVCETGKLEI